MTTPARTAAAAKRRRSRLSTIPRDTVLFFTGIMGVIYETVFTNGDRVQLLLLFGAMMGLPAFLRADEARGAKDEPPAEDKPAE